MKRNKFSKALKHLKSKKIDDKIKGLEEAAPTNSMSGVYQVTPSTGDAFRMGAGDPDKKFYPKADGTWPSGIPANASDTVYIRKGGYFDSGKGTVPTNQTSVSRDFSFDDVTANGTTSTDTLIRPSDGKPYTALPEGTESFILGPLVSNYAINHGYDDFTNIGYIQKDTRQFVLLAQIQGFFKGEDKNSGNARTWDGTGNQATIYNSNFKLEHLLWMQDRYNKNDFAENFPFNFSGGVPVERHPSNNSMGSGAIFGVNDARFGGNDDNIGTPQVSADGRPGFGPGELRLWNLNYERRVPKPKRKQYRTYRTYRSALRKYETTKKVAQQSAMETPPEKDPFSPEFPPSPPDKFPVDPPPEPPAEPDPIPDPDPNYPGNYPDRGGKIHDPSGLDAHAKKVGYNDELYPLNPNRYYSHNIDLAQDILSARMEYAFYSAAANGDSPNYDTAEINQAKAMVAKARKEADNWERWKQKTGYTWRGSIKDDALEKERRQAELDKDKEIENELEKLEKDKAEAEAAAEAHAQEARNLIAQFGIDVAMLLFGGAILGLAGKALGRLPSVAKFFKLSKSAQAAKIGKKLDQAINAADDGDELYNLVRKATQPELSRKVASPAADDFIDFVNSDLMGRNITRAVKAGKKTISFPFKGKNVDISVDKLQQFRFKGPNYQQLFQSHKPEGDLLSEGSKKRILREIRQPLKEIQELPKTTKLKGYRPNFKGKFSPQNTPDVTASKESDDIVSAKNSSRQIWTGKDKFWKGYETTERMNIIYDNLGHGSQYFDRIVGENVRLKNKKSREVQEHLNMLAHQKAMREVYGIKEFEELIDESETFDNKINDPLFTKVAKRLKKEIDYPKKPAAKGYPNEAPPKIDPNSGYHPKFGKRYKYDKLDPISAKTMAGAPTGDPEIDANVKKAAKVKEDWRSDLKNLWLGAEREEWKKKLEEGMTTQVLTGILPSTGDADLETLQTGLTGNGNIDYGEPGVGDEAMEGEGEYTCFTNFDDLDNVRTRPEYNTGTRLRLFDQETKQFRSGLVGGGAHGYLQAIPGFKSGSMRNVKPSGDYNAYEKSRRERLGLPALQGGSNLYYHLYGPTNDVLGLGYGTWNSNDGVTAARTGTRLDFNGPGSPRYAALKEIDSTGFDTIKIHALLGDNDIVSTYRDSEHLGGTLRDKRVQIYYWAGDKDDYVRHPSASTTYQGHNNTYVSGDGWRPINMKPNGELDPDVDPYIIKHTADRPSTAIDANGVPYDTDNKLAPYSLPIPEYARDKHARYMIVQVDKTNIPTDAFSVLSVRFQRRSNVKTPALTKPLTDIETSPFVRVGPTKKNEGAKERKKKVKDIIDGGLKYTETKFSKDFPVRTTLESKLFEKLKDRKIIKEGMTTQVLTGILPSAGDTDLDMLQLGATGSDLSYTSGDDSPVDGEFTALVNTDPITSVDDPLDVGTHIRSPQNGASLSLDFTDSDVFHTHSDPGDSVPGDDGGTRGSGISGNHNSGYVNDEGATNENIPFNNFNGEYLPTRVGTHLAFGNNTRLSNAGFPRYAALKAVDTTQFDTLSMNWFCRGAVNTDTVDGSPTQGEKVVGGTVTRMNTVGDGVSLFYWAGDKEGAATYAPSVTGSSKINDGWRPINVKPDGTTDNTYSPWLIPHKADVAVYGTGSRQKHSSGYPAEVLLNNKITLPPWCRDKNTRFLLHQGRNAQGAASANFGITSVRFQRRSTMKVRSLMKPLSDVESSPFVRVGPTKKNEGGKERKKKVQDIIRSGLKYTGKKFSKDFPVRTDLE